MALGPAVRALFGKHERRVADLYRSIFLNLDDYAENIQNWVPECSRILEVGCGEGAVTEKLAILFPNADILAIDVTPRAGRLYRGRTEGVEFRNIDVQSIAAAHPGRFDLVLLSDALHHIPLDLREEILEAIGRTLAPGGRFVLKDWGRAAISPIHWLCYTCDRWLTGDRVSYLTPTEAKRLVLDRLPQLQPIAAGHVRPWRNNYALIFSAG
jgi:2-polyprenyl-6-hydroxyphenyl methylase/3-demethylubiquinone-9 3-methyltransferase